MYKFLGLCLVCLWASGEAHPFSAKETADWDNFKNKYGKSYKTVAEEQLRKEVFSNNLKIVENHNRRFEEGKTTFTLGINTFADLSVAEFKKLMNGYKIRNINSNNEVYTSDENKALPASVDWRTKGAVTGVKNQAQCGSCWAFSATGSLEGQIFLKKGKLVSLSEQNLMDCSNGYGNMGCEGGLMDQAFQYVKANKGVDTEKSYPYEAQDASCRFNAANVGATLNSYTDVESGSESSLQSAVAEAGPISVAIDAGHSSFQLYSSGIYYEEDCDPQSLDHGVLAVGYGSNSEGDYWIVKNSWGESWGESGYILMARNKNNHCGIATKASYPNV